MINDNLIEFLKNFYPFDRISEENIILLPDDARYMESQSPDHSIRIDDGIIETLTIYKLIKEIPAEGFIKSPTILEYVYSAIHKNHIYTTGIYRQEIRYGNKITTKKLDF